MNQSILDLVGPLFLHRSDVFSQVVANLRSVGSCISEISATICGSCWRKKGSGGTSRPRAMPSWPCKRLSSPEWLLYLGHSLLLGTTIESPSSSCKMCFFNGRKPPWEKRQMVKNKHKTKPRERSGNCFMMAHNILQTVNRNLMVNRNTTVQLRYLFVYIGYL